MYFTDGSQASDGGTRLAMCDAPAPGEVWLVGAGPGDPGLLTLRAATAIRAADLVLHDHVPARIARAHARPGAVLIDVGKRKGAAPVPQAKIIARMLDAARAGQRVVRLKAGDPFLFARGAEEAAALAAAGIPWRVVPGVSAGLAAPAAAGIALTRRGVAGAVTFLSGHDETGQMPPHDWDALARAGGTLVVFMAMTRLDSLVLALLGAGMPAGTPLAIVAQASLPGEASLTATLGTAMLAVRRNAALPSPAMVLIGATVGQAIGLPDTIGAEPARRAAR
ncbi:uroporphyrinogen-III C-methyltransferase [Humitalea sp. 24SJ18S-53]|uniref:uroporphyrinogen-III C-methyltransferase n=1 Tax=Humitalea sp. 24SJ18S-53 TaxID=3422307 RepID=UPI003D6715BB